MGVAGPPGREVGGHRREDTSGRQAHARGVEVPGDGVPVGSQVHDHSLPPSGTPSTEGARDARPDQPRSRARRSSTVSRRTSTPGAPVGHGDHRRPRHEVVVRRHRAAVGAGHRHREQVAGGDVAGQVDVVHHDVAALAVLAHHPGAGPARRPTPATRRRVVPRAVQRRAQVVAHPAVDRHVGAHSAVVQRDRLDGADRVERQRRRPDDRPAGLDGDPRHRRAELRAGVGHGRGDVLGDARGVQRHLVRQVRDAEAAAQVHLGDQHPGARGELGAQRQHGPRGDGEPGRVQDLRPDVRVDAQQLELRACRAPPRALRAPGRRPPTGRTSGPRARWRCTRGRRRARRWSPGPSPALGARGRRPSPRPPRRRPGRSRPSSR